MTKDIEMKAEIRRAYWWGMMTGWTIALLFGAIAASPMLGWLPVLGMATLLCVQMMADGRVIFRTGTKALGR